MRRPMIEGPWIRTGIGAFSLSSPSLLSHLGLIPPPIIKAGGTYSVTKQIQITRTIIKKGSTFVNVALVSVLPIIVIALKVVFKYTYLQ